ncbi:MAG: NAD(P)H-binding protein [Acidimicrobiia bacterium]|nr:NAD(P)H-binding protein [Acidimicrobiia bacterium]
MPVIIVGADTTYGAGLVEALCAAGTEVRAFVTDPDTAGALRRLGAKVAIGDLTDASHVGGAALNAFSAVLMTEAATDDRERSFADTFDAVLASWAEAVSEAKITRVILVTSSGTDPGPLLGATPEFVAVEPGEAAIASVVAANEAAEV